MNEWYKIKDYRFDAVTITIYRSEWAMRKWLVEAVYKDGQTPNRLTFEDEKKAWRKFYEAAKCALSLESDKWEK